MHPTCKQVPPRKGSFSTTTVFSPSSPARIAASYPPGPLPIIATSYFATRSLPSAGARTGEPSSSSPKSHSIDARGGQADKRGASLPLGGSLFKTHKKPPTLTAQTAASRQTCNFSSGTRHSQPEGKRSRESVRKQNPTRKPRVWGTQYGMPCPHLSS